MRQSVDALEKDVDNLLAEDTREHATRIADELASLGASDDCARMVARLFATDREALSAVSSGDGGITWTATFTPTTAVLEERVAALEGGIVQRDRHFQPAAEGDGTRCRHAPRDGAGLYRTHALHLALGHGISPFLTRSSQLLMS